jgi:PAS domain S-box-containing protein
MTKVRLIITLWITLPLLIMLFYTTYEAKQTILLEKEKQLYIIANALYAHFPDSFDKILAENNALQLSDKEKLLVLHNVLQPIASEVADNWPGYSVGYYSAELGRLAIAPADEEFIGKMDIAPDALRVYEFKRPEVYVLERATTRQGITVLAITFPLVINGEVTGHIWANFDIRDIMAMYYRNLVEKIAIAIGVWLSLMLLVRYLFRRIKASVAQIISTGRTNPAQLTKFSELEPVADAYYALQQRERELEEEISKLKTLFEVIPVGIFIADKGGSVIQKNRLVDEIWGGNAPLSSSVEEYGVYKGWYADGKRLGAKDWALACALRGESINDEVLDIERFDHTYGTILNSAAPIRDMDGEILGAVAAVKDITGQREREKELERLKGDLEAIALEKTAELINTKNQLIDILESISDGLFTVDSKWNFTYVNAAAERIIGWKRAEILGFNLWKYYSPTPTAKQKFFAAMNNRNPQLWEEHSGKYNKWIETYIYPNGDGGLTIYFKDIEQRKKAEQELARLDMLNLVGQIAAGISHEVRNPMTTVRGFLQIFCNSSAYERDKEKFKLMIGELDRANGIITEFLSAARIKATEKKLRTIADILLPMKPLLDATVLEAGQNIIYQIEPESGQVEVDEQEIKQLILNLVRNGIEAMEAKGNVTIGIKAESSGTTLFVADQGKGIPPEVLDKIGTPFYTTKEKGTGLGLSTCYGIASRHNAKIDFITGPDGTTFFINFPYASHQSREEPQRKTAPYCS